MDPIEIQSHFIKEHLDEKTKPTYKFDEVITGLKELQVKFFGEAADHEERLMCAFKSKISEIKGEF